MLHEDRIFSKSHKNRNAVGILHILPGKISWVTCTASRCSLLSSQKSSSHNTDISTSLQVFVNWLKTTVLLGSVLCTETVKVCLQLRGVQSAELIPASVRWFITNSLLLVRLLFDTDDICSVSGSCYCWRGLDVSTRARESSVWLLEIPKCVF